MSYTLLRHCGPILPKTNLIKRLRTTHDENVGLAPEPMTPDRWSDIRQKVLDSFEVLEQYTEDLEPGTAEVIEFQGPAGKLQIRFHTQPKVLDKKTLYSHRAGGDVKVDYTYSDTDEVHYMQVRRWNTAQNDWEEMNAGGLF